LNRVGSLLKPLMWLMGLLLVGPAQPAQIAQPSPPLKSYLTPPLTSTLPGIPGNMAGTTPQTSKPALQPAPVTVPNPPRNLSGTDP